MLGDQCNRESTGGRGDDRKGRRCVAGQGDKAGYATIEIELKNEKAAGDRESV